MHKKNAFLTFTYRPKHLPADGGLHIEDWQKFMKRLRKNLTPERKKQRLGPLRYFMCGEYGTENFRPHFHALLFGENFSNDRIFFDQNKRGEIRYESPLLEKLWGKGFCTIGELTYTSAHYVSRYILNKKTGPEAHDHYTRINTETGEEFHVRPEFTTMSRREGIGSKWLQKYKTDVYPSDEVIHEGKRFRPPRFYDEKLEEVQLKLLQKQRRNRIKERQADLTPERMKVREKVLNLKLNTLNRDL